MIRFKDPIWLILLLLPLGYIYIRYFTSWLKPPTLPYPDTGLFNGIASSWRTRLAAALPALKIIGLTALVLAMARPQSGYGDTKETVV